MPDDKLALVFLTNQTSDTYKLINNYASQQDTPTTADNMKFSDIAEFMSQHYDPTKFTVRERYKFWSSINRKPGETPTELAARVRQMATTCDFPAIKNPLDEAMRTCFICAINGRETNILKGSGHCNRSRRSRQKSKGPSVLKTRGSPQDPNKEAVPSLSEVITIFQTTIQYTDTVLLLWKERPCDEELQTVQPSLQILWQEGTH